MDLLPVSRRRRVREMAEVPWFSVMLNTALAQRQNVAGGPGEMVEAVLRLVYVVGAIKQAIHEHELKQSKRHEDTMSLLSFHSQDRGESLLKDAPLPATVHGPKRGN
jgi:hypothetical protein